mmetsp:Transcript_44099/g.104345  ORF Transcript_44099/g.104345 Transcript_44099/m.104345 type:complete len:593 (-) Transcript_44099:80-1858(-)
MFSHMWAAELVIGIVLFCSTTGNAWDYSSNGEDWSALGVCGGEGGFTAQSPISLPSGADRDTRGQVFLRYPHVGLPIKLYNNGYSLAMTMPETYKAGFGIAFNSSALGQVDSEVYRLWQVNFHAPSEHLLAGVRMPLEMQLMHQRVTGSPKTAVISVFFEESSTPSLWLRNMMDAGLPSTAWEEVVINTESATGVQDGVPDVKDIGFSSTLDGSPFYAYKGSLTVPPCESEVQYLVRQLPLTATEEQLSQFSSVLKGTCPPHGNYRSVPSFTTASGAVTLIPSLDMLTGTSGPTSAAFAPSDPKGLSSGAAQSVQGDAALQGDLQVLKNTDSLELRAAKTAYNKARLTYASGKVARFRAQEELAEAERLSGGAVTPQVVEASAAVAQQTSQMMAGKRALDAAAAQIKSLLKVPVSAGASSGSAGQSGTEMELHYHPEVSLPRGLSASPFIVGDFEVEDDNGTSAMQGVAKIAPNLRQPDGPPGQIPIAELVPVDTSSASKATANLLNTTGTVQVGITLPIQSVDYLNPNAVSKFKSELRQAVAESLDISVARVQVPDVRDTLVPVPIQEVAFAENAQLRRKRHLRAQKGHPL